MEESIYSDNTYNSNNLLARFSHRTRFSKGIDLVLEKEFKTILDYGAGDNRFLRELSKVKDNLSMYAYEPVMEISDTSDITVCTDLAELKNRSFDVICCFETLEHFNESTQKQMLAEFYSMLAKNGRVILSVPVETGIPSLIKNIRRMALGERSLKDIKNTWKCLFGVDIPENREQEGYIFSHVGFKYTRLEKLILKYFRIIKKESSPLSKLPAQLNSQRFYVLQKEDKN